MAVVLLVNELVAEGSRYASRHPRTAMAIGAAAFVAFVRVLWLCTWWLLFAPAALHPVEGRISCGGLPIEEGNIAFEPVGAAGAASRTAHVTSGSFSLGRANGLVRDVEYTVRVEGFRKTGKTYPGVRPGEFSEEYEQFVLPAFNRDSQYRETMTREVLRDGLLINVDGRPMPDVKKQTRDSRNPAKSGP